MENSCVPFAIYQFLDKRVVTLVLSAGFLETFGYTDRAAAYDLMDHDMYRDAHPDDVARIADAAVQFATAGVEYNVVYRTRKNGEYRIIHARGKHVYPAPEVRVAVVTYTDEGAYRPDAENRSATELSFDSALQRCIGVDIRFVLWLMEKWGNAQHLIDEIKD
jgi:hypothetical protein